MLISLREPGEPKFTCQIRRNSSLTISSRLHGLFFFACVLPLPTYWAFIPSPGRNINASNSAWETRAGVALLNISQIVLVRSVALWGFNSFLHYSDPIRPPWKAPWGGNYWVEISLSYLYYSGYLVLGHFFPFEGCFPPVLFTVYIGVSLLHLPSGAPFAPFRALG
jgi:hypothetical protein